MSKEREDGAAAAGEGEDDGAWRGSESWRRRDGTGLSARVPLAGGQGEGGGGVGMRAELLGTGGRLDFLCLSGLSGGRAGPCPSRACPRPVRRGCGWGYRAACLRLDATARRAGAGRGGREASAGCYRVTAARLSVPCGLGRGGERGPRRRNGGVSGEATHARRRCVAAREKGRAKTGKETAGTGLPEAGPVAKRGGPAAGGVGW